MLTKAFVRDDQPGDPEPDTPHVVEVEEQERDQQPVAEGADEPADLQQLHRPGETWVQAADVAEHRETVPAWSGCSTLVSRT